MKFKDYYITEMPYNTVDGVAVDFNLELDNWDERFIEIIKQTPPDKVDELLSIFYKMFFGKMLLQSFNVLKRNNRKRAAELLKILPDKFKEDIGLQLESRFNLKDMFNRK